MNSAVSWLCLVSAASHVILFALLWWVVKWYRRVRAENLALLGEKEVIFNFVHDVGNVFAEMETLEITPLLERVLYYALRTTRASSGAIFLLDEDRRLSVRAMAGPFPPLFGGLPDLPEHAETGRAEQISRVVRERSFRRGEGLLGEVSEFGASLLIPDAEIDPRVPAYTDEAYHIHTLAAVPMRFRDRVMGVLVVVNRVDAQSFTDSDVSLLQSLADQGSVSTHFALLRDELDAKRNMDRDLSLARRIQMRLLPRDVPDLPGLEPAAFNVPALQVGGDYYDFIRVDDEHVGVAIADVSGKSIGGAIIMSICRVLVHALAPGRTSPAEVLRQLNRVLSANLEPDMFVTMLYLVLNVRTRRVRFARAGHERPLLVSAGADGEREVRDMDAPGLAIGMVPAELFDPALQDAEFDLGPGELLALYTDGITEAMTADQREWGREALRQTLIDSAPRGATAALEEVRRRVMEFVGDTPPSDDMTLVILGARPAPPA